MSRPKKCFGQNFLIDRNIISRIVDVVKPAPGDHILEVGPGRGALTTALADKGATVIAVEIDNQLVETLGREFASRDNVTIIGNDILDTDLAAILDPIHPGKWKVAANLPYNISSQIMFRFLDGRRHFSDMTLMLQREVGDRLAAQPSTKDYGILTVFFRLHFDVRMEFVVKPGSFFPVPGVDSAVISFKALDAPRVDVGDEAVFRKVVKAAFGMRRKTLLNCLKGADVAGTPDQTAAALAAAGIDGKRRGETLDLEEFARLTREVIAATA